MSGQYVGLSPVPPPPPPHKTAAYQGSYGTYATRGEYRPEYRLDGTAVDFLLPTGMLVTFTCYPGMTLADIKTAVWQEARNYPLYELMKDSGFYSFVG